MRQKISFAVLTASLLTLAWMAFNHVNSGESSRTDVSPENIAAVVKGNNEFAFDMYRQLSKTKGNVFFSPYSISSALAMTYVGAKGETAAEMKRVLHLPEMGDRLSPAFSKVNDELITDGAKKGVELRVANGLWANNDITFEPAFLRLATTHFKAGVRAVDFKNDTESARLAINKWTSDNTNGKIAEIIPAGGVGRETSVVLTNAVYFKGDWLTPFHAAATKEEDFFSDDQTKSQCSMMHTRLRTNLAQTDDVQVLHMPYRDGRLELLIFLPKEGKTLEEFEKKLTPETFTTIARDWNDRIVEVSFPKFRFRDSHYLVQNLATLGMPTPFSSSADFSAMTRTRRIQLSEVFHRAFIDINEKGTEAAAATAVTTKVVNTSPAIPPPPIVFRANHPFLFALRDNKTETIVFLGRIVTPAT